MHSAKSAPPTPQKSNERLRLFKDAITSEVAKNSGKTTPIGQSTNSDILKIETRRGVFVLKCLNGAVKSGEKEYENWKALGTEESAFLVHYHKVWMKAEPHVFLMDFFPNVLDKYIPHLLPNQLWIFTADLVRGLNWIHSRRLVHLDLKPANIFLYGPNCESYRAQIGDYGTMEKWEESTSGDGDGKYLAPERLDETSYRADPSADIFSLGLTVWAMAMKREADWVKITETLEMQICFLPAELQKLLRQLLKLKPEERPNTTKLLQDDMIKKYAGIASRQNPTWDFQLIEDIVERAKSKSTQKPSSYFRKDESVRHLYQAFLTQDRADPEDLFTPGDNLRSQNNSVESSTLYNQDDSSSDPDTRRPCKKSKKK